MNFIEEIVDEKIIPQLKEELKDNYNTLSDELELLDNKYNNDEIKVSNKAESEIDKCFPIDSVKKLYHYVKIIAKYMKAIKLIKWLPAEKLTKIPKKNKRTSRKRYWEINEFVLCIQQRKKFKLSLKDCLSIDCNKCKANKTCSVKR